MAKRIQSWAVSDFFWERVEPLVPRPERTQVKEYKRKVGGGRKPAMKIIEASGFVPHIKERGEEMKAKENIPGYKPQRWVVELAHSWFNRFRKLLVRYEKKTCTYEALIHLACSIICWRKVSINIIYG